MFARSEALGECGLTFLHVFPYSRAGTPAAADAAGCGTCDQGARAAIARGGRGGFAAASRLRNRWAAREVLIESATEAAPNNFLPVAISGETPGRVVKRLIGGHDRARLTV